MVLRPIDTAQFPFSKPSLPGKEVKYIKDAVRLGQLVGDETYTHKWNEKICDLAICVNWRNPGEASPLGAAICSGA